MLEENKDNLSKEVDKISDEICKISSFTDVKRCLLRLLI